MIVERNNGKRLPQGPRAQPSCWESCVKTLLGLSAFLLLASVSRADTIILKNGRRIIARSVTEEGDKVSYEGEEGRISLPKSMVEKVEKDEAVPQRSSSPAGGNSPRETFAKGMSLQIRVPQKDVEGVVSSGAIDEQRLQTLVVLAEKGDLDRQSAVNACLVAAAFEARQQKYGPASRWAEEALRLSGQDMNALLLAAQIDIGRQQYAEALHHLTLAQSLQPDSPEVFTLLGYGYYFSEGPEKAIRYWKQAYTFRPDEKLQELIQQTEKEEQVEGGFVQAESSHIVLSREGSEISEAFSREVLEALEQDYRDLEFALDFAPREPITVILYSAQQFADITRVPGWVGALNDGKIRVPVRGLTSMTADLARVLKHEMVHSFVHRQAQGRCPTWFNEGLAQLESGEAAPLPGGGLARIYADSRQIPLEQLEGSFMQFPGALAAVAYAESRAGVAMIQDQYGAYQLPQILKALGEGRTMGEALRQVLRTDYAGLETELNNYLTRRSGR